MNYDNERSDGVPCTQSDCSFYNSECEQNCEGIGSKSGDPAPAYCESYVPE